MGVRILSVDGGGQTALFCSTSMIAFGPVADESTLGLFQEWCEQNDKPDLRTVPEATLMEWWEAFNESLSVVSEEG